MTGTHPGGGRPRDGTLSAMVVHRDLSHFDASENIRGRRPNTGRTKARSSIVGVGLVYTAERLVSWCAKVVQEIERRGEEPSFSRIGARLRTFVWEPVVHQSAPEVTEASATMYEIGAPPHCRSLHNAMCVQALGTVLTAGSDRSSVLEMSRGTRPVVMSALRRMGYNDVCWLGTEMADRVSMGLLPIAFDMERFPADRFDFALSFSGWRDLERVETDLGAIARTMRQNALLSLAFEVTDPEPRPEASIDRLATLARHAEDHALVLAAPLADGHGRAVPGGEPFIVRAVFQKAR